MPCADLLELISAYVDGETLPAQTELVEAHCAVCPECRAIARRQRETSRLLRLVGADDWAVPDLRLRVAHATRKAHGDWRTRCTQYGLPVGLLAALAILIGQTNSAGTIRAVPAGGMVAASTPACPCPAPTGARSAPTTGAVGMQGRIIWTWSRVSAV